MLCMGIGILLSARGYFLSCHVSGILEVHRLRLLAGDSLDYAYGGERCTLLLRNRKQVAGHSAHFSKGAMPELRYDAE